MLAVSAAPGLSFLAVGRESDEDLEEGPECGSGERSRGAQSIYCSPFTFNILTTRVAIFLLKVRVEHWLCYTI